MQFRHLEENINKWTLELEDMEKLFLNQATQVNAWDQLLIKNGEKIVSLNESVAAVRLDQQRLDHELDFVAAQQAELEDALKPLEASLANCGPVDTERERTYAVSLNQYNFDWYAIFVQLAENLDGQLARMCEDLKEIISHLNTSAKAQDNRDPVHQIGKVLNAHMDSLQWIDSNAAAVERRLQEVTRLAEIHKRSEQILILNVTFTTDDDKCLAAHIKNKLYFNFLVAGILRGCRGPCWNKTEVMIVSSLPRMCDDLPTTREV